MKHSIRLLIGCVMLTGLPTKADSPATPPLFKGIVTLRPLLVEQALARGIDTSLRYGRYEDTPLMLAVRLYGQMLKTKGTGTHLTPQAWGKRALAALSIGVLSGYAYYRYGNNNILHSIAVGSLASSATLFAKSLLYQSNIKKIIIMLIDADPDINARNKEGLSALDIMRAYFPYAYQINDPDWHELFALIIKKSLQSPTIIVLQQQENDSESDEN